jgi:hypothetical protein
VGCGAAPSALLIRCCGMDDLTLQALAVRELLRRSDRDEFLSGDLIVQLVEFLQRMIESSAPHGVEAGHLMKKQIQNVESGSVEAKRLGALLVPKQKNEIAFF